MKQQPLVSFILTYYALPPRLLCEAIDSIVQLSLQPSEREIIVVDDGSPESAKNDLQRYGDAIVYVRQENGGVSSARNTGLKMAKGCYIQFLDGDDCLLTAPYNHCLDILRQHEDADMVMFDFTHDASEASDAYDGHAAFSVPVKTSGTTLLRTKNLRGSACCYLFRQAVRGELLFTQGIAYGEDEEFTPQLLLRAKTVYTTDARAYYYRERPTSAVHQQSAERIDKRLSDHLTVIRRLNALAGRCPHEEHLGLQRRVAQLTMDHIYNTIIATRSAERLDELLDELRHDGLFPLPDHAYTTKYVWFRRLTNSRLGRQLLLAALPKMRKER